MMMNTDGQHCYNCFVSLRLYDCHAGVKKESGYVRPACSPVDFGEVEKIQRIRIQRTRKSAKYGLFTHNAR